MRRSRGSPITIRSKIAGMAHTGSYGGECCLKHLQVGEGLILGRATMWAHINMQEGANTPRAVLMLIWREILEGLSAVFTAFLLFNLRYSTKYIFDPLNGKRPRTNSPYMVGLSIHRVVTSYKQPTTLDHERKASQSEVIWTRYDSPVPLGCYEGVESELKRLRWLSLQKVSHRNCKCMFPSDRTFPLEG